MEVCFSVKELLLKHTQNRTRQDLFTYSAYNFCEKNKIFHHVNCQSMLNGPLLLLFLSLCANFFYGRTSCWKLWEQNFNSDFIPRWVQAMSWNINIAFIGGIMILVYFMLNSFGINVLTIKSAFHFCIEIPVLFCFYFFPFPILVKM